MEQDKQLTSLPENAYRELKPGEEYTPVMPASSNPKEVTPYSVTMGVIMAVVFSAAAGNDLETMARVLDTIPYEIMTSVSGRVKRIYLKE